MSLTSHRTRRLAGLVLLQLLAVTIIWDHKLNDLFANEILVTSPANLTMNDLPALTGLLEFSTDVPTRVGIRVNGTREAWLVDSSELRTDHSFPLLGFEPDSQYNLSVILTDETGTAQPLGNSFPIATSALPDDFPQLDVRTSDVSSMEPGYTLIPIQARGEGDSTSYVVATDAVGNVRWYTVANLGLIRRQADGSLLLGGNALTEMDMLGNVQRGWYTESIRNPPPDGVTIATNRVHHDTFPLPDGNFLALITRIRSVENFPTSMTDVNAPRQTADVEDTPVIEFAPDGSIVRQFDFIDVLDPTRIGYDVIRRDGRLAWAWGNAVIYDERDDSIITSLRHQDAVVKLLRSTGELKWILGPHDNWGEEFEQFLLQPVGEPFEWQYHQHAPMLLANGNLLIHDNGNHRASPPDEGMSGSESYTRAVEYAIDEETMEITQVWEYGRDADEIIYSPTLGDADWLSETDNILITFGNPRFVGGELAPKQIPRIVEVDRDGNVVFDLAISYPAEEDARVYRSDRIPALYPPEYVVTSILQGDLDEDGSVGFEDFLILSEHYGTAGGFLDGDLDGNGTIQFQDFLILANNLGQATTSPATVPEPTSAMMLLAGLIAIAVRQLRRPRFR